MANKLINALRFIAAAVIGYGIAYMWLYIRPEDDFMMIVGVGVVSTVIAFLLLYFMGKSGSS